MDGDAAPQGNGRTGSQARRAVGAALVLLLLLLLVAVAAGARGRGAIAPSPQGLPPASLDYLFTLGIVLLVAAVGTLLLLRVPFKPPTHDPTGFVRLAVFMAFVTAFAYLALRAAVGPDGQSLLQGLLERRAEDGSGSSIQDPGGGRVPRFRWEVAALAAALAALFAGRELLRRYRRRRGRQDSPAGLAEELAELLDDTVDDLRAEADARRAIIAAYARMERTLAGHGLARRPAEAPLEYLGRALGGLRLPAEAALDLTALFERAKFSAHRIDEAMKSEAIAALVSIRDELRAAA